MPQHLNPCLGVGFLLNLFHLSISLTGIAAAKMLMAQAQTLG